ncbi:anti-sigma factor family protein [Streptomyces sp. H39-C1]|uniref:anti-sigma factor family protein n=1 Tax=Streptomyces sp. H39-C1 TaxID=3004355 RepID=UPI0022AF1DE8|nr:zf-HC2 domain-containing protein [Streptomyces sp. H39-C1]MCZ4101784.1 zf-HC2 domain-containing protein [Streptomyces sp. H39-C1]
MTQAPCLTEKSGEKTSIEECRTVCELLAGHALKALAPEEASAVRAHLATCDRCRDKHDVLTSVPAHLSLLRDALACGKGRHTPACAAPRDECRHASPRRRRPDPSAVTMQITLPQWVSRTSSCIR